MFTKARNKSELIDETKYIVRKSLGIKLPDILVTRIINSRSDKIHDGIENKVPRIIIGGIGSIHIKKGKNRFDVKKGREYYVKKANKYNTSHINHKFALKFKIVSNECD